MFGEFNFNNDDWFTDLLNQWPRAGKDFVSTGIKDLDNNIAEVMRLNKQMQSIGRK